jgi:uncharacterized membrane protein YvbJ
VKLQKHGQVPKNKNNRHVQNPKNKIIVINKVMFLIIFITIVVIFLIYKNFIEDRFTEVLNQPDQPISASSPNPSDSSKRPIRKRYINPLF